MGEITQAAHRVKILECQRSFRKSFFDQQLSCDVTPYLHLWFFHADELWVRTGCDPRGMSQEATEALGGRIKEKLQTRAPKGRGRCSQDWQWEPAAQVLVSQMRRLFDKFRKAPKTEQAKADKIMKMFLSREEEESCS